MDGVATDTHCLVWYLEESNLLSATALARLRSAVSAGAPIFVPTICIVEIIYLTEKKRITAVARARLFHHFDEPACDLKLAPLDRQVAEMVERVPRNQIPDMPDRIIAATALALGVPLVTRDRRIRTSGIETIW